MINELSPSSITTQLEVSKAFRERYMRNFFVMMAVSFIVLTVLGFVPDYIMMYSQNMSAHWFSHVHGGLMSLWLIVFVVQAVLERKGNLKLHRQLGLLSIGLGAAIWISMIIVMLRPRIQYPGPIDDDRSDVLLVALHGFIFFGLFFTWGVLQRKKVALHRRLMVLASIAVMQGSIDRVVRFIPGIGGIPLAAFITLDLLLLLPLILYDIFRDRKVHRITLIGVALIIAGQLGEVIAMGTLTWHKAVFTAIQPFVDPILEAKLTAAQVDPLLGNYGASKDWYCTISSEHGKLFWKMPGIPRYEIIPISETEAFHTKTLWRFVFIKDENGKVVKVINKQAELVWELNKLNE